MNKMMYTHWRTAGKKIDEPVVVVGLYYIAGDGPKALVISSDNVVHEVDPFDLKLAAKEYNKAFAE